MPVTLIDPVADADALAADGVTNNANLRAKFSEDAGVGIGDGDIASDAGMAGTKLSTTNQVPEDRLASKAVSARVLRSDAAVSANRAVTNDHVVDSTLTKRAHSKTTAFNLSRAELDLVVDPVPFTLSLVGIATQVVPSVFRHTTGPNYDAVVRAIGVTGASTTITNTATVTPVTALPTAGRTLIGLYLSDVTYAANVLSGNVVFISLPNT